jgi:hypothetical protein
MKKVFFSFIFIFISTLTFASNDNDFKGQISLTQVCNNESSTTNLFFNDLESFNQFDANQLIPVDECTVSVSVTVEVSIGIVTTSVTMTAEGIPCEQVKKKIAELKKAAMEALGL